MRRLITLLMILAALPAGCGDSRPQVVVYVALDREFSEPVLKRFEKETGIRVLAKYDTEATKSVGLAEQLRRESNNPRCDVFWNNEILNTLRLAEAGILQPYSSPVGHQYPEGFRTGKDLWYGFAARVRILIVNTQKVGNDEIPTRLEDLTNPRWKGQVAIAKPLFGTTATHAACLFASWGPEKTKEFFKKLKANDIRILSGNKQVAVEVGSGQAAMGLTDTDDALAELRAKRPVRIVYLDTGPDQIGSLFLPNTVALVRGAPQAENGKLLIDFLLSPSTEVMLATGKSGQLPLHPGATVQPELGWPAGGTRMNVDFTQAVRYWDDAMQFIKNEFSEP